MAESAGAIDAASAAGDPKPPNQNKTYVEEWLDTASPSWGPYVAASPATAEGGESTQEAESSSSNAQVDVPCEAKEMPCVVDFSETSKTLVTQSECVDDFLDKLQSRGEELIAQTNDMLERVQKEAVTQCTEALKCLEAAESQGTKETAKDEQRRLNEIKQHEDHLGLREENRYLHKELVAARAAIDKIFSAILKRKDTRDADAPFYADKVVKRVRALEHGNKELSVERGSLRQENAVLSVRVDELKAECARCRDSELRLRNAAHTHRQKIESHKEAIAAAKKRTAGLERTVEKLQQEAVRTKRECEDLTARLGAQEGRLADERRRADRAEQSLDEARRSGASASQTLGEAKENVQSLSDKVLTQASNLCTLTQQAEALRAENKDLRGAVAAAAAQGDALRAQLDESRAAAAAKHDRVHELRVALADSRTKLTASDEAAGAAQERINELTHALQRCEERAERGEAAARRMGDQAAAFAPMAAAFVDAMSGAAARTQHAVQAKLEGRATQVGRLGARIAAAAAARRRGSEETRTMHAQAASALETSLRMLDCVGQTGVVLEGKGGRGGEGGEGGKGAVALVSLAEQTQRLVETRMEERASFQRALSRAEKARLAACEEVEALHAACKEAQGDHASAAKRMAQREHEIGILRAQLHEQAECALRAAAAAEAAQAQAPEGKGKGKGKGNERVGNGTAFERLEEAVARLAKDAARAAWERDCAHQELAVSQDACGRLRYQRAAFGAALASKEREVRSLSQSRAMQQRDHAVKTAEYAKANDGMTADLHGLQEAKDALEREVRVLSRARRQDAARMQEAEQRMDVCLRTIASSMRCMEDTEARLFESIDGMQASFARLDGQATDLARRAAEDAERVQGLGASANRVGAMLDGAARDRAAWQDKCVRVAQRWHRYASRAKPKLRRADATRHALRIARRRCRALRTEARALRRLKLKEANDAARRQRTSTLAVRLWRTAASGAGRAAFLNGVLRVEKARAKELADSLEKASRENRALAEARDAQDAASAALRRDLERQSALAEELKGAEATLRRSKQALRKLQEAERAGGARVAHLQAAIRDRDAAADVLQGENRGLATAADALRRRCADLEHGHKAAQADLARLRAAAEASDAEAGQLRVLVREMRDDLQELELVSTEQRHASAIACAEADRMRVEIAAKEDRLRELRGALARANDGMGKRSGAWEARPVTADVACTASCASQDAASQSAPRSDPITAEAASMTDPIPAPPAPPQPVPDPDFRRGGAREDAAAAALAAEVSRLAAALEAKEIHAARIQATLDDALASLARSVPEEEREGVQAGEGGEGGEGGGALEGAVSRVIATWREACRTKDAEIVRLTSMAAAAESSAAQAEAAREDATAREDAGSRECARLRRAQDDAMAALLPLLAATAEPEPSAPSLAAEDTIGVRSGASPSLPQLPIPSLQGGGGGGGGRGGEPGLAEAAVAVAQRAQAHAREASLARVACGNYREALAAQSKREAALRVEGTRLAAAHDAAMADAAALRARAARLEASLAQAEAVRDTLTQGRDEKGVDDDKVKEKEKEEEREKEREREEEREGALRAARREVEALRRTLGAWDGMRAAKDAQIADLLQRCRLYQRDLEAQTTSVAALRRKLSPARRKLREGISIQELQGLEKVQGVQGGGRGGEGGGPTSAPTHDASEGAVEGDGRPRVLRERTNHDDVRGAATAEGGGPKKGEGEGEGEGEGAYARGRLEDGRQESRARLLAFGRACLG